MTPSDYITFRRLKRKDLPLLYKWLNKPHVREWYDSDKPSSLEAINQRYAQKVTGEQPVSAYIILYEGKPMGYIQKYFLKDYPEEVTYLGLDEKTAGIDLFIGEPDFVGKGRGSIVLRKFLKKIVFIEEGITNCIIDPDPKNVRAIKSFEKVGFKYVKTIKIPQESHLKYLMSISKKELG